MPAKSHRRSQIYLAVLLTVVTSLVHFQPISGAESEDSLAFFESKIRPALVKHCLDCHANDAEASGGLLLDSRDGWLSGGDSGAAIIAGDIDESLVIRAISYEDPNLQMPPDGRLPEEIIDAFRKWVSDGAVDPRRSQATGDLNGGPTGLSVERAQEHWAYRPIAPPAFTPRHFSGEESCSPVDYLIHHRLRENDLQPAPRATSQVLVRRLTFDLTGLPPSLKQLEDYGGTDFSVAYDELVEQLLASPQFGEHFARKWMDVARYAESITLRGFVLPEAWRYRDYLIEAYADDRPFNQMSEEQLAGDLLHADQLEERKKQLVATAFLAMGNTNLEQQDKSQLEMDFIDEQLEVIGRAFLGQTIGCARCHDHKFDPIPTRDYYALAGIFRSAVAMKHDNVSKWIEEPLPLLPAAEESFKTAERELAHVDQKIADLNRQLSGINKDGEGRIRPSELPGLVIDNEDARLVGDWKSSTRITPFVGNGYLHAKGGQSTATFEPEMLKPGRYEVRISYTPHSNRATKAKVSVFSADGEVGFRVNQRTAPNEDTLWYSLGSHRFEKDGQAYVLISSEDADGAVVVDAVQFLSSEVSSETPKPVRDGLLAIDKSSSTAKELGSQIASLEKRKRRLQVKLQTRPKFLTVTERSPAQDIPIHIRGDVHNLAEVVPRGFLSAISPAKPEFDSDSSGRREFAAWVSSDDNPLTARVYANRVWTWLMGRGIVSTANNFGTTGVKPSHPELLDWLANELIRSGWSTKHLVRVIVGSNAYKRAVVEADSVELAIDPENSLYWNGHARRLPVEALRDAMLSVSGELDLATGGTLIPPGTAADYNYQHESTRRSVYHPVMRNSLPPLFEAFDFADTSVSVGRRARSTVATQALVLTNHPWVAERARQAAKLVVRRMQLNAEPIRVEQVNCVIEDVYMTALGRQPTRDESSVCRSFLEDAIGEAAELELRMEQLIHALFASLDFRYLE